MLSFCVLHAFAYIRNLHGMVDTFKELILPKKIPKELLNINNVYSCKQSRIRKPVEL